MYLIIVSFFALQKPLEEVQETQVHLYALTVKVKHPKIIVIQCNTKYSQAFWTIIILTHTANFSPHSRAWLSCRYKCCESTLQLLKMVSWSLQKQVSFPYCLPLPPPLSSELACIAEIIFNPTLNSNKKKSKYVFCGRPHFSPLLPEGNSLNYKRRKSEHKIKIVNTLGF